MRRLVTPTLNSNHNMRQNDVFDRVILRSIHCYVLKVDEK